MKKITFLSVILFAFISLSFGQNRANHFVESFENPDSWSGYTTGTVHFDSGDWEFVAVYPETAGDSQDGSKACRINDDVANASITSPSVNTIGTVSFYYHRPFSGSGSFTLQKSVGGGAFVVLSTVDFAAVTSPTLYSFDVNDASNDIVIRIENDDNTAHLTIDYVTITDFGGVPSVAAPTFSPAAGTYTSAQDITISTTEAGATIYYTTDGSDPDNTSTTYVAPVNIAATTTLKAIAYAAGMTESSVSTAEYIFPVDIADIATLRMQAEDGTVYNLTGEAFLTFQQSYRNKKYIQDGTAGIEIDDSPGAITTSYTIGDGITGIIGTLNTYNGMLQFQPSFDPGAATSTGNTINPTILTATEFVNDFESYEGQLVHVDNLMFADAGNFSNGQTYGTSDPYSNTMNFRTSFYSVDYIGTAIPSQRVGITGIANMNSNNPYLTARDAADMELVPPGVPLSSGGILIAGLLMAGALIIRRGRLF